jgi:glucose uptake protein
MVDNYALAVVFCVVTMLCWGSWANTQKLAGKSWRFELYYWDYVFGVLLMAVIFAFTLGSLFQQGPTFLENAKTADAFNHLWALLGGVVFNAANILLVAAIALAGMAVAFPVGIGLALVVGVFVNYAQSPDQYRPELLFAGVGAITLAIILDAVAYSRLPTEKKGAIVKGLVLSVLCGILMGFFYLLVAKSMPKEYVAGRFDVTKLTPYTAMWFFAIGMLASNLIFNRLIMAKPVEGPPVTWADYGRGKIWQHLVGILGGMIWAVGMTLSIVAAGQAGFAISYGLGQGATMIAAIWGVFIWREFRAAPKGTNVLLGLMFIGYITGLVLIVLSHRQPEAVEQAQEAVALLSQW